MKKLNNSGSGSVEHEDEGVKINRAPSIKKHRDDMNKSEIKIDH